MKTITSELNTRPALVMPSHGPHSTPSVKETHDSNTKHQSSLHINCICMYQNHLQSYDYRANSVLLYELPSFISLQQMLLFAIIEIKLRPTVSQLLLLQKPLQSL